MKRILILLLAFFMALALCSCSVSEVFEDMFNNGPDTTEQPTISDKRSYYEIKPDEQTFSEGYEPVVSTHSYDELATEGEKEMYLRLLDVCYDISPEQDEGTGRYAMPQVKLEGYTLTEAQVRTAVKALSDDRPEIFWLTGTIGYFSDDSTTIIQAYASYSAEEVDERVNAVRSIAGEFYTSVPDGLSEYDREMMVHDFLIERAAYDEDVDTVDFDSNDPDINTAYGALVEQKAVCEGYARAFQMLMNGLGVECVGVMGAAQEQYHIWNAVQLGEEWYYTDVTWDDREESYARYIYFNINEETLLIDHTMSPMASDMTDDEINGVCGDFNASVMNIFVPSCTDSSQGYYCSRSPRLTDYDGADVKSGLLYSAENEEEYFVFYVDESLDFNEAVTLLFAESPQYFFSYIKEVNDYLPDYSIDSSNISYYTLERARIAAVELNYY